MMIRSEFDHDLISLFGHELFAKVGSRRWGRSEGMAFPDRV
jgi:hypothetical protein